MKYGKVRITLGSILLIFQVISLIGNSGSGGNGISLGFDSFGGFLYDVFYLLGYFFVGIIGLVLLVSGIFANARKTRNESKEELTPEVMATRETTTVNLDEQSEPEVNSYLPTEQHECNELLEESSNDNVKKHCCSPKKAKPIKVKYCSRCGSKIDSDTKKCTGCGKQYFRGFRFTKFSIAVIALAIVSTVCVSQYIEIQDLEDWQNDNFSKVRFFDIYAEIVADDGTKVYHKYGCTELDRSKGFWIYNSGAVESMRGYTKCSRCH